MKDVILSRAFRVADARTAAAFAHPLRRRLVLLFAARERSVAEMASATGEDLKRLHYHVTALQQLGLLEVARELARAGRAVKLYRAVAEAFFVPEQWMTVPPSVALTAQLRHSLEGVRDATREGVLYYLSDARDPRMRPVQVPGAGGTGTTELWRVMQLSRIDALALSRDIEACLASYAGREHGNAKAYLVHFAIAPRVRSVPLSPKKQSQFLGLGPSRQSNAKKIGA